MFPSTRPFLIALALGFLAANPATAFAQGAVREHGAPPAPDPTVDRDQRRGVHGKDPLQWEVGGKAIRFCVPVMVANLRREGLSRPAMLSPGIPLAGWSDDGGNWLFKKLRAPAGGCESAAVLVSDVVALYNSRNKRYLTAKLTWSDTPQFFWVLRGAQTAEKDGRPFTRFSIYSTVEQRYLMLCHDEADARKNGEKLCFYNPAQERPG